MTSSSVYKHLFGPVPSRRLGRSLGVDLVPFKTCSFDCIFCQLGRTTDKTIQRQAYVPALAVKDELARWLSEGGESDYITLAGSGEPTLNSEFGDVVDFIKERTPIPVALLTNGSLFGDSEVRVQAARADVVKVSLSVWDQFSLERVNRPHPAIRFASLIEGMRKFRTEFGGKLWLEVFLMAGVNDSLADVGKIAKFANSLGADRVQLNTSVRPPCEVYAHAVSAADLELRVGLFEPRAEVIAEFSREPGQGEACNEDTILSMIRRRPCTMEQICRVFGLHRNEASKYLGKLMRTGRVMEERRGDEIFFERLSAP
jgi:wyosine [tRNA(Phe)-imidazoG37] synthetase (radical SAM superfamily)